MVRYRRCLRADELLVSILNLKYPITVTPPVGGCLFHRLIARDLETLLWSALQMACHRAIRDKMNFSPKILPLLLGGLVVIGAF